MFLVSALSVISGHSQEKPKLSQSGYMIRSICGGCNSTIGREYDPTIGALCSSINHYLGFPLTMPPSATFDTLPSRLLRGVLAHLLAAKLAPTEGVLDQHIWEYLADHTRSFHPDWHLYYWFHPHPGITVFRDFSTKLSTSRGREISYCNVMKFPPLAMMLTDAKYFHGLPDLCAFSHFGIDDPGRIYLEFTNPRPHDWPEGVRHCDFIVTGSSGNESLYGLPKGFELKQDQPHNRPVS